MNIDQEKINQLLVRSGTDPDEALKGLVTLVTEAKIETAGKGHYINDYTAWEMVWNLLDSSGQDIPRNFITMLLKEAYEAGVRKALEDIEVSQTLSGRR